MLDGNGTDQFTDLPKKADRDWGTSHHCLHFSDLAANTRMRCAALRNVSMLGLVLPAVLSDNQSDTADR